MKKLHELALSLAVVLVVGAVGMSVGERLAVAFAEEGEREGEVARKPAKENPEQREGREKQEREAVGKIISDEAFRLLREAKELEAQGKPDAAAELRTKAKRIEAEARAKMGRKEPRERKEELVSDEAFSLLREAKELEAQGRPDEAEKLRAKAKAIEAKAREKKQPREGREGERVVRVEVLERLHGDLFASQRELEELASEYGPKHPRIVGAEKKVRMIKEQIRAVEAGKVKTEKAPEREGRVGPDEVRGLLEKAERIEAEARREAQELRQRAERIEAEPREKREGELKTEAGERIEAAIREHMQVAEKLAAEGKGDAAEEHVRKAESLRQELVVRLERRPEAPPGEGERFVREKREPEEPRLRREGPAPEFVREPRPVRPEEPRPAREPFVRQPMPGPPMIAPQVAELRREVNQLREELAHIRELLQEVLERRAPAPSR